MLFINQPNLRGLSKGIIRFGWHVLVSLAVASLLVACTASQPASTQNSNLPATNTPVYTSISTLPPSPTAQQAITTTITPVTLPSTDTVSPRLILPTPSTTSTLTLQPQTTPLIPTVTPGIENPRLLGHSTGGWPIEAYQFGTGPIHIVFIGGIHGGYEWNTILLAYQAIDYFTQNPGDVPSELSVYIIPSANPDGQVLVTGQAGRFTASQVALKTVPGRINNDGVDLNRNWDCNWKPTAIWREQKVNAGKDPFSEVENQILRDFLTALPANGVIFWHSAMPGVFPGSCNARSASSEMLSKRYAEASGYPYEENFTSYEVSGDAADWLSSQGIPAISVELTNHRDVDWEQNLKGILSVINLFQSGPLQEIK